MTKQLFLSSLHDRLSGLPREDVEERLRFYNEMIEDRIEDGLSEEDAVAAVGSIDEIVLQIVADVPLAKIAKEKIRSKRRLSAWEIVLLTLGSPVWVSLLIAALAIVLSLYVSLWAVIISLWAVFASLVGCAFGGIVGGIVFAVSDNLLTGIAAIAAALVCAGIAILLLYGCKAATKGAVWLTKSMVRGSKNRLLKKEETSCAAK